MTTVTAREFNRDVTAATRAADEDPVVITDRGEPPYVLLSIEEFQRLSTNGQSLVDRLSMDDDVDVDFSSSHIALNVPDL